MKEYTEPLTIGQFITKLEQQPQDNEVRFDFAGFVPTTFDSYRGFYEQLALGFTDSSGATEVKVCDLIKLAKEAQHDTFTGYKGGEYTMTPNTPLWAANHGRSSSTAIVDVVGNDYQTVIVTAWLDY